MTNMYKYQVQARVINDIPGPFDDKVKNTGWYQLGECNFRNPVMEGLSFGLEEVLDAKKKNLLANGETICGTVDKITQIPLEFGVMHDILNVIFYMPEKREYKRMVKLLKAASERNRLTDVHNTSD